MADESNRRAGNRADEDRRRKNEAQEREALDRELDRAGEGADRVAGEVEEEARAFAGAAQKTLEQGMSGITDQAARATETMMEMQRRTMDATTRDLQAVAESTTASAAAAAEVSSALMDWARQSVEISNQLPKRLFESRSLTQAFESQLNLVQTLLRQWVEMNARMLQLAPRSGTMRVAGPRRG
jgi:hypothetical protein